MKSTVFKALTVINAVLILLGAVGCVYILTSNCGIYYSVSAIVELIALIFSVFYYLKGYQKNAAGDYRLYMLLYAFTYLVENVACALDYDNIGVESKVSLTIVFSMLLYGNALILAIGKDLGKKLSYTLCGVNIFVYVLPLIGMAIPGLITFANEAFEVSGVVLYAIWLILAFNTLVMTIAKYADKAARNTQ